ncbi:MAG: hypothetical protein HY862_15585 [Chloroflexi bacterium]|nr:hypothetical protein [Chloroflexota bacterium]
MAYTTNEIVEQPYNMSEKPATVSNENSVKVADTVGVIVLGMVCIVLLFALLRSQKRTRQLLEQQIKELQKATVKEAKV